MQSLLKIAHRGAAGYKPENTLEAFQKALDFKVDGIELDVHLSSDGEIMVIHDETINRTATGKGFVDQFTSLELKKYGVPTLTEVFDLVSQKCFINIELKGIETAKHVNELILHFITNKKWEIKDFIISSFDWGILEEFHVLNSKIRIGVLTETSIEEALAFAKKIKAFSIHPDFTLLTKENVALIQKNSFEVYTWTVNTKVAIEKIREFNVNGIISDFPDRI